ncbi:HlyD family secretion protein [Sphingobacteriales bacterium UPWRP_1]|nr:HlyD family secretion protein [Sphingobacteriales bacterium TSM_CSM]PSJ74408.1 HlyD family secretion protein [Sphingobacteriales bacterium UPWRP_1]
MKKTVFAVAVWGCVAWLAISCQKNNHQFDASGTFEANEVIVSSETAGKIIQMFAEEGKTLPKDTPAAVIESTALELQKAQIEAGIEALQQKTSDAGPQIAVLEQQAAAQEQQVAAQQEQLRILEREKKRTENLLKAEAATQKQLDDINGQIAVLQKQIAATQQQIEATRKQVAAQKATVATMNRSILSEKKPLEKRVEQVNEQLQKTTVKNPITGTVLVKYAEAGEVTAPGKPLYKIANLNVITLRAYVSGAQLSQIKLNQQVKVLVDAEGDTYKEYSGIISAISDKAEFTPKTIQTKEERVNLVYAMKITVKNDGYLKIGMYGEVKF